MFYRYLAIIKTYFEDYGELKVTFLKFSRSSVKVFQLDPVRVSCITFEQIIEVMPAASLKVENAACIIILSLLLT